MIYNFIIIVFVICFTILIAPIAIIISFFDSTGNIAHKLIACIWGKAILFISRVKVTVKGLSNISLDSSYVYMPNHESIYDIPVILGYLPVQFRWLAKAELFKIPIFGSAMRSAGYISIDRKNHNSAISSLNKAAAIIKEKDISIVIFPEGTRSVDGKIGKFKKGGFFLAINSGVPIVPVIIHGTRKIALKKSLSIKSGKVTLEILKPIKTTEYTRENKDELLNKIRDIIKKNKNTPI